MWLRTALILVLFLVAWRIVRGVFARLATTATPVQADEQAHRRGASSTAGATESKSRVSAWPPDQVTDVSFREELSDESRHV